MRNKKWLVSSLLAGLTVAGAAQERLPGEKLDIDSPPLSVSQQKLQPGVKDGKRTVQIIEDRNQTYMASKVYKLQHMTAADLTPFVLGAVKRYDKHSQVERLDYKKKSEQYLVVHTGEQMLPYVDDMVAKLDRPGKKDDTGSIVEGDGIYRFVYYPKFRFDKNLVEIGNMIGSGDGRYFYDQTTNMLYWKDSKSDGESVMKWYQAIDRPVPQVEVKIKVYELSDNDIKELGVDYVSWKNGPGAELLGLGADMFQFNAKEQIFSRAVEMFANMGSGVGGVMFAPQFDASFLRLLDQKGKADVFTSGSLTVVNDFTNSYHLKFTPGYQNISKNKLMEISVANNNRLNFELTINQPVICFENTANAAGILKFNYVVTLKDVVERNNTGTEFMNNHKASSDLTVACGTEKLLAVFSREHDVNQYNGMPFLGDIPIIKYVVGADTHSKAFTRLFVTLITTPVRPEASLSPWAGEVITAAELLRDERQHHEELMNNLPK
jgi:type II secretory pathway component GspD/PulD (secretin)